MNKPVVSASFTPVLVASAAQPKPPADAAPPVQPKPPSAPPLPSPARMRRDDREFLPAALEILETPPSPVTVGLISAICLLAAAALAWLCFGKVDIYAIAPGKIQPSGRSKVVQPMEAGKVVSVFVDNGSWVQAGDVVVELDPTEAAAEEEGQRRDLEASAAEAARRKAAVEAARSDQQQGIVINFPGNISPAVRQREEDVLRAEIEQLWASVASYRAQVAQARATIQRLTESIAAREKVIALTRERVDMRELVQQKGAGSRALIIDALERHESGVTTQVGEQGQLREQTAAIEATEKKILETIANFIADQNQKLAEAERKRDRLIEDLIKAQSKNERTRLKAPVAGYVQQLAVTTIGQVVTSGQALMVIVPPEADLEIEALIPNKDVGFVRVGQPAVVKIEAFPFSRYGTLDGTVTTISADAVDPRSAPNLSEAAAAARPQTNSAPPSGQSAPELAFPARIALAHRTMFIGDQDVNLSPGMSVTVEIKTGTRRIISYILSPLNETVSQAAHER